MITLRPFTREDWFAFAGAEHGANPYADPMISESDVTVDGKAAIVIADAVGVHIYFLQNTQLGDITNWFQFVMNNIGAAVAMAADLPAELTTEYLTTHGFSHL